MTREEYLLTIAIPTYNRAQFLDGSLAIIQSQFIAMKHNVEIIVSDNCSSDNTKDVVEKYICDGVPIKYIRNQKNLGMDGNFVQCFRMAKGRYVWCLGDDDYLAAGTLDYLLNILYNNNYGLIHCAIRPRHSEGYIECTNLKKYISDISYWITLISANIVNTVYVQKIDFEKYMGTFFTLIPLYMTAAIESPCNIYINKQLFKDIGKNSKTNGGYNLFEVFLQNYLSIWKSFAKKTGMNFVYYENEKRRLFTQFIINWIYKLLFLKEKGNFKTDRAYIYLFKYYWYCPYFYFYVNIYFIRSKLRALFCLLGIKWKHVIS
jgi:glycosyltransferase involved in cell wall biosynthesis